MDSILDIIGVMNKYSEQILELTGEHLFMSISAIVIAIALGLPLAILMTKNRTLAVAIQTTINIIQTIPSISMLLIIMIFLGLGYDTAIVALALYSMLPIIANTYAGLTGVDKNMIEAGTGMGMTSGQLLRMVMIPLAMPIILAGVRVAAVVAIGAK